MINVKVLNHLKKYISPIDYFIYYSPNQTFQPLSATFTYLKTASTFVFGVCIFLMASTAQATHIRAGEITARVINCATFTYEFTITGYTDKGSDVPFGGGEVNFGDGSEIIKLNPDDFEEDIDIGNNIGITTFVFTHTFPGPGDYIIGFKEFNRNADVVNMVNSVNTPFYVETKIIIDPFLGCNETINMLIPPIDRACTGVTFFHNPGAYDPDGDSISYELTVNKKDVGKPVDGYRFPNDAIFNGSPQGGTGGGATYSMDPISGDLIWDSPGLDGEYNIAFKVLEWRKIETGEYVQMGYVTRDMQIIVDLCDNLPPEILIPADTCIEANTLLEADIEAVDPNNDPIRLEAFGGILSNSLQPQQRATFTPAGPGFQPSPTVGQFKWTPDCNLVRRNPYQVHFKASDDPTGRNIQEVPLASFKTYFIQVVAPAPVLENAVLAGDRTVELEWEKYSESTVCATARPTSILIYRKVGENQFNPDNCETGIPEGSDYKLIGRSDDINQNTFTDDGDLEFGTTYCYRLVAVFTDNKGGESYASQELCVEIGPFEGMFPSLITNVDIVPEKTDDTTGEIIIKWTTPFDADPAIYQPPYTYELYEVVNGSLSDTPLYSGSDTTFVHTGINTLDQSHTYQVQAIASIAPEGKTLPISAPASDIRLRIQASDDQFTLRWEGETPYSTSVSEAPTHLIFRNHTDPSDSTKLSLYATVDVTKEGQFFVDDAENLRKSSTYCYYVETKGSYGNDKVQSPLLNRTQLNCNKLNDGNPPCAPVTLAVNGLDQEQFCEEAFLNAKCELDFFQNILTWDPQITGGACQDDIFEYEIYFSENEDDSFELVGTSPINTFTHADLSSFKGCYYVVAIDGSGNPSPPSEIICMDNCPFFELPNMFTPNGDGKNDTFSTLTKEILDNIGDTEANIGCPRFVEALDIKIYNPSGGLVFEYQASRADSTTDLAINWDGKTNDGKELSSGSYFYSVDVKFNVLEESQQNRTYKGWVRIVK
ncbi:hypothetical protein PEPS_07880 [Persicobacter psychrovividus]|uniref:Gliding motility-associated C-terminal domain-containing protein n=2 Tax=Persicobacter psychrovividus TaxID=387638 RepID=A0ABN6L5T4_9BACT|nr:hypothetical protein PEPS_07880 [Persicobacter psychrovividus]